MCRVQVPALPRLNRFPVDKVLISWGKRSSAVSIYCQGYFSASAELLFCNICLDDPQVWFEYTVGHVGSETRSLGQIKGNSC